ncbi:MAG: hypothetical protein GF398_00915 [Chitinivibrionales bacterium]|nr:hypothetical protein [Chitinivibrionales bacterium]
MEISGMTQDQSRKKKLHARINAMMRRHRSLKSGGDFLNEARAGKSEPAPREKQEPIVYRRSVSRKKKETTSGSHVSRRGAFHVELTDAVEGSTIAYGKSGCVFEVVTPISQADGAGAVSSTFRNFVVNPSPMLEKLAAARAPDALQVEDFIFMDLETTGLGASPLFLIGTMAWEGDEFVVRQYFARTYAEEAAALSLYHEACRTKKALVSFNGKSYDVPYVKMRSAANGLDCCEVQFHFDLLHECRRIWKGVLPDCKLQTLESRLCGRTRCGDIPGSRIPDAYHAYVRTQNAWQMVDVLKHNLLDLVTLADLMTRFPSDRKDIHSST